MLKLNRMALLLVAFFVISPVLPAQAQGVPAPTVLEARIAEEADGAALVVSGVSAANTEVLVYLDDRYIGTAESQNEGTGTDNFYLSISEGLSAGAHRVSAVARDKTSLVLSPMGAPLTVSLQTVPAPVLIAPNERTATAKPKPLLTGLVKSGFKVHVFIDGKLNGSTGFLSHPSGTANFAYRPFLDLSVGRHSAWAIAEDKSGRKSIVSNILDFRIEQNYPAPWLVKPVVNAASSANQPFIAGLAKNDSLIKVFVDHRLAGQLQVKNHPSGTANFAIRPGAPLPAGRHLIYATATDSRGKESLWSNLVFYNVAAPQITPEAAAEEKPVVKGEDGPGIDPKLLNFIALARLFNTGQKIDLNQGQLSELESYIKRFEDLGVANEDRSLLRNLYNALKNEYAKDPSAGPGQAPSGGETPSGTSSLEDLIKGAGEGQTATAASGLLDESRERQSRLKLNLAIFILFLVAVIAWIFWVNRELIKEKQEQEKANDKK